MKKLLERNCQKSLKDIPWVQAPDKKVCDLNELYMISKNLFLRKLHIHFH